MHIGLPAAAPPRPPLELSFPSAPFVLDALCGPLEFIWQSDDDACLVWHGDVDSAFGYARNTFPRTFDAWIDAIHPDDRDAVLGALQNHLASGEPFSVFCRTRRQDGSVRTWQHAGRSLRSSDGEPIAFIGSLRPVVADELAPCTCDAPGCEHNGHHLDLPGTNGTGTNVNGMDVNGTSGTAGAQVVVRRFQLPVPFTQNDGTEVGIEDGARAQSLLRTAARLNGQLGLQEVCEAICEEAGRTLNAPSAVMLFNKARDAFVPTAVRNMPADYDKRYTPTLRSVYEGHVAQMGTLFLFRDAQATPDLPNHKLYQEVDMRTIGIASLIRDGEVLGLLKVYSFGQSRTFDANELALLQGLADIAAQAIANARLVDQSQRRMAHLNALRAIDLAILGSSDVNVALGVVLDQVRGQLGADASCALLLEPHMRTLRYANERGFRTNGVRGASLLLGQGLAGRVALERKTVALPDLGAPDALASVYGADLSRSSSDLSVALDEGFEAYYGVPLVANGQIKGVLELWHRAPLPLDEEGLEFLETLAGQAAIAVDNAGLFRDLQRSNDELALAYDQTLLGWSGALDLRDKETEGHTRRVTQETVRLAREMGLGDADIVHIRRGALLHDIGKMGVPDAILLKPGPLSDDEWVEMKKHPGLALELLSPIGYLKPALDIPYAHHEKWDGTGYPRGLSGEQIPLAARLFAVVDVWDALCSDRPYRKGWPIQKVLDHIRQGSGSHFDPRVVEAFLRLHEDQLAVADDASLPAASLPAASPPPPKPQPQPELPARVSGSSAQRVEGVAARSWWAAFLNWLNDGGAR